MKDFRNVKWTPPEPWSLRTPRRPERASSPMDAKAHQGHLFSLFGNHRAWAAALAARRAKDRVETPGRMAKAMLRQPEPRPEMRLVSPDPRRADWKRLDVIEARAARRAKRAAYGEIARQNRRAA